MRTLFCDDLNSVLLQGQFELGGTDLGEMKLNIWLSFLLASLESSGLRFDLLPSPRGEPFLLITCASTAFPVTVSLYMCLCSSSCKHSLPSEPEDGPNVTLR